MKSVKKIGVVTATRAEYGILTPLLLKLKEHNEMELSLFVTGTHLSHEFGYTRTQIINDGFKISEEVDCLVSNDTPSALGKTSGLALMGLVDSYERQKPDLIVLLGDRYEILCAAIAANLCRIPIAHLHGGEVTEGAYDEGFRHAITKLSHIHFTTNEDHQNRVLQLGENPEHVFNVGALGIDNIKKIKPFTKKELEKDLGIAFLDRCILVTLHPETLDPESAYVHSDLLLAALARLDKYTIIFTGANADSDGRIINSKIIDFVKDRNNCLFVNNLGRMRYISMLHIVNAVVGNSSSGIIEVPSFGIPTINIGNRQKGRTRSLSVIDIPWKVERIYEAITQNIDNPCIEDSIKNPYGDGNTAKRIVGIIEDISLDKSLIIKEFNDIVRE